jgi:hypothetical protein
MPANKMAASPCAGRVRTKRGSGAYLQLPLFTWIWGLKDSGDKTHDLPRVFLNFCLSCLPVEYTQQRSSAICITVLYTKVFKGSKREKTFIGQRENCAKCLKNYYS